MLTISVDGLESDGDGNGELTNLLLESDGDVSLPALCDSAPVPLVDAPHVTKFATTSVVFDGLESESDHDVPLTKTITNITSKTNATAQNQSCCRKDIE